MTPSRREFVASMATVPFLAQSAVGQQRQPPTAADPILEQLMIDLRDLSVEFETQPASRKAVLRAFETTLSIGAAHFAANYDAGIKAALRRRQSRQGRAALIQQLVDQAHDSKNHGVSFDAVDNALTYLEQSGLSGCFRDGRQVTRKVRQLAPDQVQAVAFTRAQFDYCADLIWMIQNLEGIVAIVCGLAILEPTVGGEVACGALTLALGLYILQRQIFC